jgi:50S ribosomal protein L16 3-hydroxylase
MPLPWNDEWKRKFIDTYWHKSPLLIRGAYPPDWRSPVDGDELAGFACDEECGLQARVIMEVW